MAIDPNRWTLKTQEAFAAASETAHDPEQPRGHPRPPPGCHARPSPTDWPCLSWPGPGWSRPRSPTVWPRAARLPAQGLRRATSRDVARARDLSSRPPTSLRGDMGDEYLSVEHLLLALSDLIGVTRDELLTALRQVRGSHRVTSQNPEEQYQALERYGRDLTEAARQGKLDPVIGRDEEIRRIIQVL